MKSGKTCMAKLAGALLLAIGAGVASVQPGFAGTYTVRACWGTDLGGWQQIENSLNLRIEVHCPWETEYRDYAGMTARATKKSFSTGQQSGWMLTAPPATRVVGFSAETALATNVVRTPGQSWQPGLWDAETGALIGDIGGTTYWRYVSLGGFSAQRVGMGLRCYSPVCGPVTQATGTNAGRPFEEAISARHVTVTMRDDVRPAIVVTRPVPSGWQGSGRVSLAFTANDNVGITTLRAFVDTVMIASISRPCYDPGSNATPRPCADPAGALTGEVNVSVLSEGMHDVTLRALDPAGNFADQHLPLLVDHEAPAAPRALSLRGGYLWTADNRFDVTWTNPRTESRAPIAAADYQLCPVGNSPYDEAGCVRGRAPGEMISDMEGLQVPGDGAWRLRLSLRDAAGNGDGDRAAAVDGLRLDRVPPDLAFLPFDPEDPTRVRLRASDATSGVAGVEIEARRQGDRAWRALGVDDAPGRYSAILDDEQLADGRYELRARARDRAGNERSTTNLADGQPMEMVLPVRSGTALAVGRVTRVRVKGSRGARPRYRRVLVGRPSAGYGQPVSLEGRLADVIGNPRAGAPVEVLERVNLPGVEWRSLANVHTAADGRFTFRAAAGPARILRFRYPGSSTARPGVEEVELRVRAGVTLAPSRDRVRNGDSVVFRGRLLGAPIPGEGKLLALQARTTKGWRTFATPRARARDGRWAYRYHFTGTTETFRYAFRTVAPREAGYPYAEGTSRVARVVVRGGG